MEKLFILILIADMIVAMRFLPRDKAYFLPIAALASLGVSAYSAYQAGRQRKKANELKPSNYVPAGVAEAEANARMDANAAVAPGYLRGLESLRVGSANTIEAAKRVGGSAGQVQQAVADTDQRQKEMEKNLAVNNEQFRLQRRQDLNQALRVRGQYEQKSADDYNAAVSALKGAASQNEYNAVSGAAEGLIYSAPDSMISPDAGAPQAAGGVSASSSPYLGYPSFRGYSAPRTRTGLSRFQNLNLSPYEIEVLRQQGLYR
jgi:hypothetical protein